MQLVTTPSTIGGGSLIVDNLSVRYGNVQALTDATFRVDEGEVVAVIGPNGAGKSSLFKAVCGLVSATGSVSLAGAHCHHHRDRMNAAYIPQQSDIDLDFPITVQQLVLAGRRRFLPAWRRPRPADRDAVADAMERTGITGLGARPIRALSGGQLQRALLARAIAQEADVFLLDEAMSGVDAPGTAHLLDLFHELAKAGSTLLVSTHDLALARRSFDRCLAINGGVVGDGRPADVLQGGVLDATFGSGSGAIRASLN